MMILIALPADRTRLGMLKIVGDNPGDVLCGPFECLGKADNTAAIKANNPRRLPIYPLGDTPTGLYAAAGVSQHEPPGDMGEQVIWLNGVGGDALTAMQNGRKGLAIHAGRDDGGPYAGLWPTDGCVRVSRDTMTALVEYLGADKLTIQIVQA